MVQRKIDCAGKRFGKFLAIEEYHVPVSNPTNRKKFLQKVKCVCDCGAICHIWKSNLISGNSTKCISCANSHDITGKVIGKITVLKMLPFIKNTQKGKLYLCKCACGNIFEQNYNVLRRLKGIRCAKCPHRQPKSEKKINLRPQTLHEEAVKRNVGKKINNLKIISFSRFIPDSRNRKRSYYLFKCKCGKEFEARIHKNLKSCGCSHKMINIGDKSFTAKLKNNDVKVIRELYSLNLGYTQQKLADMFGVSIQIINRIIKYKCYKYV